MMISSMYNQFIIAVTGTYKYLYVTRDSMRACANTHIHTRENQRDDVRRRSSHALEGLAGMTTLLAPTAAIILIAFEFP